MTERTTVLLADDHPLFLDGLTSLLATDPTLEVVGAVPTGEAAVELAREVDPEVVVLDLNLPGIDGIEATRQITARSPSIAVLILTMFEDDDSVFAAVRAGARGYVVKGSEHDQILAAVRAVAQGEVVFGAALAQRLVTWFSATDRVASYPFPELTNRERDVLDLVAAGLANQAIADRLGIRLKTVRNQVSNVLTKLQVTDRAQAIIRARDAGLGRGTTGPG